MDKKPRHVAYIDGLRAVAVLAVIIYHLNAEWLPGGFAGVDVFFVISGFVVALSVSELGPLSLGRFLTYFYARRLVRIVPALVVMLLATFVASAVFIPQAWLSAANQTTGLLAFLGLSNFVLAANTGNYFSPLAEFNPFTHTWSLAVEEQFYLIFPWLFIFWLRAKRSISIGLFAIALVGSFISAIWLSRTDETMAFYMVWSRFWELAIGVLLFQIMRISGRTFDVQTSHHRTSALVGDIGLVMLGAGLILARPDSAPFPSCVLPTLGTALILGGLHSAHRGLAHFILTRRFMVLIGKMSYSLYLWHWPVFTLFRWTVGLEPDQHGSQILALLLTVGLSVLSYLFVEQPPRKAARHASKAMAITAGLVFTASGLIASNYIAQNQWRLSRNTVTLNAADWYPNQGFADTDDSGCVVSRELTPIGTGFYLTITRHGCAKPVTGPRIFAIGDSHALGYEGMFKVYTMQTGAPVVLYNNGGCPFISLKLGGEDSENCQLNARVALADMKGKLQKGDVVFLASLRLPRFADQWVRFRDEDTKKQVFGEAAVKQRTQSIVDGKAIVQDLTSLGARVIFEAPKPVFRSPAFRCAESYSHINPLCEGGSSIDRAELEALREPLLLGEQEISASSPNVSIWDPFPVLCPAGPTCSQYSQDGKPIYFDGDHVSGYGNRLLAPSFTSFVVGTELATNGLAEPSQSKKN